MKFLLKILKYMFAGTTNSTGPCGFTGECDKCGAPIHYTGFSELPRYDSSRKDS